MVERDEAKINYIPRNLYYHIKITIQYYYICRTLSEYSHRKKLNKEKTLERLEIDS